MPQGNDLVVDPAVLEPLPPRERFKVALRFLGHTVASWARAKSSDQKTIHESQVWMAFSGDRDYPEIIDLFVQDTGIGHDTIARWIAEWRDSKRAA